jgi:CRP-like cAMP-binding protein
MPVNDPSSLVVGARKVVVPPAQLLPQLMSSAFLAGWKMEEISTLIEYLGVIDATPNTLLFREGEPGSFLALVLEGSADILKHDMKSGDKKLARVGVGMTFGEMAIIDGDPRSATCVCNEKSRFVTLTRENFVRLIREQPPLGVKLLLKVTTLLSRRLRATSGQLIDALHHP